MITADDAPDVFDLGTHYVILGSSRAKAMYAEHSGVTAVPARFTYESGTNHRFLSVKEIRELVKLNLGSDV